MVVISEKNSGNKRCVCDMRSHKGYELKVYEFVVFLLIFFFISYTYKVLNTTQNWPHTIQNTNNLIKLIQQILFNLAIHYPLNTMFFDLGTKNSDSEILKFNWNRSFKDLWFNHELFITVSIWSEKFFKNSFKKIWSI